MILSFLFACSCLVVESTVFPAIPVYIPYSPSLQDLQLSANANLIVFYDFNFFFVFS